MRSNVWTTAQQAATLFIGAISLSLDTVIMVSSDGESFSQSGHVSWAAVDRTCCRHVCSLVLDCWVEYTPVQGSTVEHKRNIQVQTSS